MLLQSWCGNVMRILNLSTLSSSRPTHLPVHTAGDLKSCSVTSRWLKVVWTLLVFRLHSHQAETARIEERTYSHPTCISSLGQFEGDTTNKRNEKSTASSPMSHSTLHVTLRTGFGIVCIQSAGQSKSYLASEPRLADL